MAQKKNKYHYYVLVLTNYGPVFVTDIPERNYAKWDKLKAPLEFSKTSAEDIALGLNLNGYTACMVVYPYEVDHQLFFYDKGRFEWKWDTIKDGKDIKEEVTDETTTCPAE